MFSAAEERKRRVVTIAERLGRLRRIGLHEATVTVGKVEGKEVNLPLLAADHRHRFTKVRLGVTGGMDERHEHLTRPKPLTNVVLHNGVAGTVRYSVCEARCSLVDEPFAEDDSELCLCL